MKKQFLFLLVCIIMLSCTAQKQKKKTIVKYMNPESSAAQIALMTKIARRFEKKYPDIHIELITGIKTEKIMAAIASGSGVDLFFNFMNIYSYIAAGSLVDLAPYISRYKMETTDFFSFAMKEVTHGQKIYGLPVQLGTSCLAYNKALLENENIPLPAPYMSKEDFFRYITTISSSQNRKDKAEKIFPLNSLNFIGYFESRILSLLNPDGSYNKKSRSVIVENMKTYQSIYKILPSQEELSSLSGGTTGATAHFKMGKTFLQWCQAWMLVDLSRSKDLDFAVTGLPVFFNGHTASVSSLCIPAISAVPEAAFRFASFYVSEESTDLFAAAKNGMSCRMSSTGKFFTAPPDGIDYYISTMKRPDVFGKIPFTGNEEYIAGVRELLYKLQKLQISAEQFTDQLYRLAGSVLKPVFEE